MTYLRLPHRRLQSGLSLGSCLACLLLWSGASAQLPVDATDFNVPVTDQPVLDESGRPVEVWTTTPEVVPFIAAPDPGILSAPFYRPGPGPATAGLRPRILYRYQYAQGIPNGEGPRYTSHVHELAPGIRWHVGNHLRLDYSPVFTQYSNDAMEDTVDHALTVDWSTTYQAWRFDAGHRFNHSNSLLIETGAQTERDSFQTTLGALYALNSRLGWESRLGHYRRSAKTLQDFTEYNGEQRLLYSVNERLGVSVAAAYGYVKVDDGSNHEYIRPRVTLNYRPGEKLTLRGWAGAENRWYKNGMETTSPVYQLAADYLPVESTKLTVSYNRAVSPSYFEDAVARRRSLEVSLTQRFLGRYFLTVRAGRQNSSYSSFTSSAIDGRRDRTTNYSARLSTTFRDRGYIALFYEPEADNESNRDAFSYSLRSHGAEVGWQF
jgi:hypothetical protein